VVIVGLEDRCNHLFHEFLSGFDNSVEEGRNGADQILLNLVDDLEFGVLLDVQVGCDLNDHTEALET
jgi:hypothetical protein